MKSLLFNYFDAYCSEPPSQGKEKRKQYSTLHYAWFLFFFFSPSKPSQKLKKSILAKANQGGETYKRWNSVPFLCLRICLLSWHRWEACHPIYFSLLATLSFAVKHAVLSTFSTQEQLCLHGVCDSSTCLIGNLWINWSMFELMFSLMPCLSLRQSYLDFTHSFVAIHSASKPKERVALTFQVAWLWTLIKSWCN